MQAVRLPPGHGGGVGGVGVGGVGEAPQFLPQFTTHCLYAVGSDGHCAIQAVRFPPGHGGGATASVTVDLGCNGAGQLFFASVQSSACVTFFLSALLHENPVQQNSFMFKACLQVNLEVPVPQLVAVLTADILQFA